MDASTVVIPKVWRSEVVRLTLFVVTCVACVVLSQRFPGSVMSGPLFSLGEHSFFLNLPLFWLVPAVVLLNVIMRIYNVRYSIDSNGLQTRVGILSFNQVITRIRFEDIRSIETEQTIIERILDIGIVEMGTAATAGLEMIFEGVAAPRTVQEMIQREREARIRLAQQDERMADQVSAL